MALKRTLILFLTVCMLFTVAACKEDGSGSKGKKSGTGSKDKGNSTSAYDDTGSDDETTFTKKKTVKNEKTGSASGEDELNFDELFGNSSSKKSGYSLEEVQSGQYAIVSGISARVAAAKITNANVKTVGKLKTDTTEIYSFNSNWAFNHAVFVTFFKGKLYTFWMQGHANEDDLGQRIVGCNCDNPADFGNWGAPYVISDSKKGTINPNIETVQMVSGFFNDGKSLSLYYSSSEYRTSSLRDGGTLRPLTYDFVTSDRYIRTLQADGNWGPERQNGTVAGGNLSAYKLSSGRWIFPTGAGIRYSDDGVMWYSSGASAAQIEAAKTRGAKDICEPGCYETADGIMHVLVRSDTKYLWQTQSADNGQTWTDIYPTRFTNDSSKFQTGRLSDGRYYIIGNTVNNTHRCPLTISLSDDGYNYTKEYIIHDENIPLIQPGLAKGGVYGYPTCCDDGKYMYVAYSVNKETVRVTRFLLSDLK